MRHKNFLFPRVALLALCSLLSLAACGPRDTPESARSPGPGESPTAPESRAGAPAVPAAPSWQEAAEATYTGLFDNGAVTLADGLWQGQPYVEGGASAPRAGLAGDFLLSGDLDSDGAPESVVLLWTSTGGSGTFDYLAVLDRAADGTVVNRATAALGDRVKLRSAEVLGGRIVVDTVQAGPGDAACCPGQKLRRTFVLEGDSMAELAAEDQGRLSLADLSGSWELTHFSWGEAVGEGIGITLVLDEGRISGSSACNRYNGSVAAGEQPGEVALAGPLISTRMACPESLMDAEGRYLRALLNVTAGSFMAGKLALTWSDGEAGGILLFGRSLETGEAE
jgi:heat shock protein HslJ